MNITFSFLYLFLLLTGCKKSETTYKLVGKDGNVIYFQKQKMQFNEEQKEKQKNKVEPKEPLVDKVIKNDNFKKKELNLDSNAYTLRSVMDNVVKNDDINQFAKIIDSKNITKSIKDFEHIPYDYFENVTDKERLTVQENKNYLLRVKENSTLQEQIKKNSFENMKENTFLIKNKFYLQIGSFFDKIKPEKLLKQKNITNKKGEVIQIVINGKTIYRAVIGPFNLKSEAESAKQKIIQNGHFDILLFKY